MFDRQLARKRHSARKQEIFQQLPGIFASIVSMLKANQHPKSQMVQYLQTAYLEKMI